MQITVKELCVWLDMPSEAVEKLETAEREIDFGAAEAEILGMTKPQEYEEARQSLMKKLGADEDGWKLLGCMMQSMRRSWELYQEKQISKEIFIETMKCFPRFIREHKASYGRYGFDRGFWTGRQLSLMLFRLGALEFEMLPEGGISVHIPSDAELALENCHDSYQRAEAFFSSYYPDAAGGDYVCESWLMSPALKELLPEGSRILQFQNEYEVRTWHQDSNGFLEWVFKRSDLPIENLPEDTSLQRRMKEYLRNGGKVGEAEAVLRPDFLGKC